MTWRGKPLSHWMRLARGRADLLGLRMAPRCEMCDLAWEMKLSEKEFLERFDEFERAQLLASYRNRNKRNFVMSAFPLPQRRRKGKK